MIRVVRHPNGVVELAIDNPPVNALGLDDIGDLLVNLRALEQDSTARAVVLRAEGRGFCGGGDVKEVQALPGHEGILGQAHGSLELTVAIAECPIPVIGAIHGFCIGLGVLVAGVCDILVCAPKTRFVLAEADNGAASGVIQASGLLPPKRLRTALFTCEPFHSEELYAYGSVAQVVPQEDLRDLALAVAGKVADKRPAVIRALKKAIDGSIGPNIEAAYRRELAFTFELNLRGDAFAARDDFTRGRRAGYLTESHD